MPVQSFELQGFPISSALRTNQRNAIVKFDRSRGILALFAAIGPIFLSIVSKSNVLPAPWVKLVTKKRR